MKFVIFDPIDNSFWAGSDSWTSSIEDAVVFTARIPVLGSNEDRWGANTNTIDVEPRFPSECRRARFRLRPASEWEDSSTEVIGAYADRADAERAVLRRRDRDRDRGETSRLDILSMGVAPSSEGATFITREWLATHKGWRPLYCKGDIAGVEFDSPNWSSHLLPFVRIEFGEHDGPTLWLGTSSAGWVEVATPATRDDLRRLATAMKSPLRATEGSTQ